MKRRLRPLLSALPAASIVSGCHRPPAAEQAALQVAPDGELTLQGQPVERALAQPAIDALVVAFAAANP